MAIADITIEVKYKVAKWFNLSITILELLVKSRCLESQRALVIAKRLAYKAIKVRVGDSGKFKRID